MPRTRLAVVVGALCCLSGPAAAHPHVFVEPHLTVEATPDGHLKALRNTWRMDETFSASVLIDFDKNADGALEKPELAAIGKQVAGSIVRWNFYTKIRDDGAEVGIKGPPVLGVTYDAKRGQLVFDFAVLPDRPLDLRAGTVSVSTFDDTYFVAFDYKSAKDVTLAGLPKTCHAAMSAPSADEAAKSWMATIAAIPADADVPADGIKFSDVLSTKFRIDCAKR